MYPRKRDFNLIILDASGSMASIAQQAVDGVNETIQTIRSAQLKHEDQEHFVTLVSFNSAETKKINDCASAMEIQDLAKKEYKPNCCTPLYDAMGFSITELKSKITKEDKVLVTVITDGEENDSKEYSGQVIANLVDTLKNERWMFTYIGANQDVAKVAASIHIHNSISFAPQVPGQRQCSTEKRKLERVSLTVWQMQTTQLVPACRRTILRRTKVA